MEKYNMGAGWNSFDFFYSFLQESWQTACDKRKMFNSFGESEMKSFKFIMIPSGPVDDNSSWMADLKSLKCKN